MWTVKIFENNDKNDNADGTGTFYPLSGRKCRFQISIRISIVFFVAVFFFGGGGGGMANNDFPVVA